MATIKTNNKGDSLIIITNDKYKPINNNHSYREKMLDMISILFNDKKFFNKITFIKESSDNILDRVNKIREPFSVMFMPDTSEENIIMFKNMIFENKKKINL